MSKVGEAHRGWTVISGTKAKLEAIDQNVMGQGENFAAVLLVPPSGTEPSMVKVRGTITCHGCHQPFPLDRDLMVGFGMGSVPLSCPCGCQITFLTCRGSKKNGHFVVVHPFTSLNGQQVGSLDLFIDDVREIGGAGALAPPAHEDRDHRAESEERESSGPRSDGCRAQEVPAIGAASDDREKTEKPLHPDVMAFSLGANGAPRQVSVQSILNRRRAMEEHERAVGIMDGGDHRSALQIFKSVLTATADDPDPMTYLNIAVCHAYLREFGQSLSVLEEAMQRWPDNARLRENYEAIKKDAPRGGGANGEAIEASTPLTATSLDTVRFKRKFSKPNAHSGTDTYEEYTAPDESTAKSYLATRPITQKQYYVVVETPQGAWGKDIMGTYKE